MEVKNEVRHSLYMGLGVTIGAGLTLLAHSIWTVTAGPAQERFLEILNKEEEDKLPLPEPLVRDAASDDDERVKRWFGDRPLVVQNGILRVLISDQHIDTWTELKKYNGATTQEQQHYTDLSRRAVDFIEFLKTLRALSDAKDKKDDLGRHLYQSVELYINGDLTDIPLHAAHTGRDEPDEMVFDDKLGGVPINGKPWQGVLPTTLDTILSELHNVVKDDDPRLRIFYFTGNHDIGIGGLRYFRPDAVRKSLSLPSHVMWNPGGIIQAGKRWVYLEHGHAHDPVLWLYMRYAIFDLLRGGFRHQERRLLGRMQRGGKVGQNSRDGAKHDEKEEFKPKDSPFKDFAVGLVKLRYRHAARRTAKWLNKTYPKQPFTIVFGHTHIEDKKTFQVNCTEYTYINAGSWAGNQSHQTFWVIEPNGDVSEPLQWPCEVPAPSS